MGIQRHEGHVAVVVQLRQSLEHVVGEDLARRKEAEPHIPRRNLRKEIRIKRDIGRLDRSESIFRSREGNATIPLRRIGSDREGRVRSRRIDRLGLDLDAGVKRNDALCHRQAAD